MTELSSWYQTRPWRLSVVSVVVAVLIVGVLYGTDSALAQEGRIDAWMNQAEQFAESDSIQEALDLYEQVLEQDSTVSNAYREKAALYAQQEKYVEAAR